MLSRMQQAVAHAPSVVRIPSVPHGRPQRINNRTSCLKTLATLVQASAEHQARLNALPSAAESQQS